MTKKYFVALIASAICATGLSHATLLGLPPTTDTNYATWDLFSGAVFENANPGASNPGLFTANLDSNTEGGMTFSPDRIYGNGNAFDMAIDGVAVAQITTLSLQLKYTAPAEGAAAAPGYFAVSLSGAGAGLQVFLGDSVEGSNTFYIYQWTWTGLNIAASDAFQLSFTGDANHVSLDTIRLTDTAAAAVPEPSTYALIGLGVMFLLWSRRKSVKVS